MEKKDGSPDSDADALTQMTPNAAEADLEEKLLFINNLPIDTSEQEIDQIYSRCGPLESIQLFNLRPDLDPGPLTAKEVSERRRKNRVRNKDLFVTYSEYRRNRPRTPVYGMLRFRSAEGYRAATVPELCIFGCVIRRHPVLSIQPRLMKTLYLEGLPQNLRAIDVELRLAQLLHPRELHITLDGMSGVGAGEGERERQDYSVPVSCEIKFEEYQTASQIYRCITDRGDGGGEIRHTAPFVGDGECQVHWFQTPQNSMGYWTRDLIF